MRTTKSTVVLPGLGSCYYALKSLLCRVGPFRLLPSPSHGDSEARLRVGSRPSAVAPASLRNPASLMDRPRLPCRGVRRNDLTG
jgi:hypothetical protein